MTLTLHGRKAALTLVQAEATKKGAQLETVLDRSLTDNHGTTFSQPTKC
ncbi:hypothetical protein [Streptomyces atratus]